MGASHSPGGGHPCKVCGGACKAFPDIEVHERYPFMSEAHKAETRKPKDPPVKRPPGKRKPAEDRARKLGEDR